ncbi:MAG: hypothetical protein WD576_01035 [Nitriliruptoraceae bacterium]
MDDSAAQPNDHRDPFVVPNASPRFATTIVVASFVFAILTVVSGLAAVTGPVGMALGLIAHVKGSRLGIPAAFVSGAVMIGAMAAMMYLR